MRRRIFTLASALSFLVFVATSVLWVRSYFVADAFGRVDSAPGLEVRSRTVSFSEGVLVVTYRDVWAMSTSGRWDLMFENPSAHSSISPPAPREIPTRGIAGIGWNNRRFTEGNLQGTVKNFCLPTWPVPLLTLILPLAWIRHIPFARQHQRHAAGLCRHCGYRLTGNTSGVCPECGTAVAPKAVA